ncbi:MAG TPA: hypothetical protein VK335_02200 [Bryobacteraceae bacterium]|nr:hypothetical protein [Bryobacteraceae bacterium]
MSSLGMRHPTDEQLLHFADGEMTASASEEIRRHLKACWHCRHELEEIEQTISECVRYRKVVLDTSLPSPPQPWFDIYPRLARIDELQMRQRWMTRILEPLTAMWSKPRRWVPAVAMIVLIAVVVQQFRQAPSVQAAELLRKAVAAADSRPRTTRRIRIHTRTQHLTRAVGGSGTSVDKSSDVDSLAGLESLFQAAHYSWEDPLSAKSFAAWRDQLPDKRDELTREPDHYQLRTSTDSGELAEATLKLSTVDLHTVEGTLLFRNREWVEISELPDVPAPSLDASGRVSAAAPTVPVRPSASQPLLEAQPALATPGEELAVLSVLHYLGADLGDPIEVTRAGGQILVTGAGIGLDRQQEIREKLRTMPRVTVRFSSEPAAESLAPEEHSSSRISVGAGAGPLQAEIERHLGGRAPFEQLADQVFDMTDRFMSRAHALRRLAQRFPPGIEAQLTADERKLLERLRQEHAGALVENVIGVDDRLRSALDVTLVDTQPVSVSGLWQDETEPLFVAARHAETMLVALLGASPDQTQSSELPAQAAASLAQLRRRAENYERLPMGR